MIWLTAGAEELSPYDVSPGVLGFLVTFALAVASIGLLVSMSRKLRRVEHREQARLRAEARAAGADPGPVTGAGGGRADSADPDRGGEPDRGGDPDGGAGGDGGD